MAGLRESLGGIGAGGGEASMTSSFWKVILVIVGFSGFLMGYAVPPLLEVGMIGGGGEGRDIGIKSDVDEEMEEYYRNLLKDN
jgi:hypothetical protein